MARYRFALRPKWILSHLFVATLVVVMIALGFWQLDRLHQRRDRNAAVRARTAMPVADVTAIGKPGDFAAGRSQEFRRVTATGTYLSDDEVLVRSRSLDGAPGSWVVTPLEIGDGVAVAVNRGWIPNSGDLQAVPAKYRAPAGTVTVTGLVRATETKGTFGATDPTGRRLTDLARADVARLDQQVDDDLLPFTVQLQTQDPAVVEGGPIPVPEPPLDEGPHLSYAFQWFTFSAMTVVVYGFILHRKARDVEREGDGGGGGEELAEPAPASVPDPEPEPLAEPGGGS